MAREIMKSYFIACAAVYSSEELPSPLSWGLTPPPHIGTELTFRYKKIVNVLAYILVIVDILGVRKS